MIAYICPLLAASLAIASGEPTSPESCESRVKWICPDEEFEAGLGKDRYYRADFHVREGLARADARWGLDDVGAVSVDGRALSGSWNIEKAVDVTEDLKTPGRHVLAVRNRNGAGIGGVCLLLTLAYSNGETNYVCTTDAWRCSVSAPAGWERPDFDDSAWPRARKLGDMETEPWALIRDMSGMILPEERREAEAAAARLRVRKDLALERIKGEPKPQCRIVYDLGRARLDVGGRMYEPVMYNTSQNWRETNRKLLRQVSYFRDAGIHLLGLGIDVAKVWRADGSIDFSTAEEIMLSALAVDPDARFVFSINMVLPPRWWVEAHPDELVGYQTAEVNVDETQCLRNCAAPSAASEVWRRDFADFERRLVGHLERSPFASRIFAYRTDWGINHEWHYYGMRELFPDNGKAMTAAFRKWLRRRYEGDVTKLRAAWRDGNVTFDAAMLPTPTARRRRSAGLLRDPVEDCATIDYQRCHAQTLREFLVVSDRAIKDACGGRALVGNYGGYFFGNDSPAEGCHLENDAVLDEPCVDFQCSPQVYGKPSRMAGAGQYARCLLEGLRSRGKLSIQEADNSTAYAPEAFRKYNRWSRDVRGDIAILARDFAQTLCWGCGFWYFDFGSGWYAAPEFAEYFRKLMPIRSEPADCRSVSEVVVVGDYESIMFSHIDWPPPAVQVQVTVQVNEIGRSGVPFDTASVKDLAAGRLKDYKVYVFPNLFYVTPEKAAMVERLRQAGKRLVWIGPAGTLDAHGARAIALPGKGEVVSEKALDRRRLRDLFREWGVHVYNDDPNAAVYACASYVALHNADAGQKTIRLPKRSRVAEVYPVRRLLGEALDAFSFEAEGPATSIFRIDPPADISGSRPLYTETAIGAERLRRLAQTGGHDLDLLRKDLLDLSLTLGASLGNARGGFRHERATKRLEMAENLVSFARRQLAKGDRSSLGFVELALSDLGMFRSCLSREVELWKTSPDNPNVPCRTLNIRDFGAAGDGKTDDAAAFANAFSAVADLCGAPSVLRIPAGDYLILSTKTQHHLLASGIRNCTVAGESPENTRLVFGNRKKNGVVLQNCVNVTVRDVDLRYRDVLFCQGTVLARDMSPSEAWAVIRPDAGTMRPDDPVFCGTTGRGDSVCSQFTDQGRQILLPNVFYTGRCEALGDGTYKVYFNRDSSEVTSGRADVRIGAKLMLIDRDNSLHAVRTVRSEFCNFERVWVRNSRSGAFTVSEGRYVTARDCRVFPLRKDLMLSTNADTFFNSRGSHLSRCVFRNMNDDGCNSLSSGKLVAAVSSDRRTVFHKELGGERRAGDIVQLLRPTTGEIVAQLHVKATGKEIRNGTELATTTFEEAVPPDLVTLETLGRKELSAKERYDITHANVSPTQMADYIYAPQSHGVGFICCNNEFGDLRGIGIQVQCPSALIESNRVDTVWNGMKISSLLRWIEGPPPYNVVVRGNVLKDLNSGILMDYGSLDRKLFRTEPFRGIRIEGNVLSGISGRGLFIANANDVEVRDNVFVRCAGALIRNSSEVICSGNIRDGKPYDILKDEERK